MFEREVLDDLLRLKTSGRRKTILLCGADGVGKKTIALEYGKKCYRKTYCIDLAKALSFSRHFHDADELEERIANYLELASFPADLLIIFDSIQRQEGLRPLLGALSARISSQLLEIGELIENTSIFKGEQRLTVYPLSFAEFVKAYGLPRSKLTVLKQCYTFKKSVPAELHKEMLHLFKIYSTIGGYPLAVSRYLATKNTAAALRSTRYHCEKNHRLLASFHRSKHLDYLSFCLVSMQKNEVRQFFSRRGARRECYEDEADFFEFNGLTIALKQLNQNDRGSNFTRVYLNDPGLYRAYLQKLNRFYLGCADDEKSQTSLYAGILALLFCSRNHALYFCQQKDRRPVDLIVRINGALLPIYLTTDRWRRAGKTLGELASRPEGGLVLSFSSIVKDLAIAQLPIYLAIFIR